MYQSATRNILNLPMGPHGSSNVYEESLYVGDCTELGIGLFPHGDVVDGEDAYQMILITILDANNGNLLAEFDYQSTDGNTKYFSIGKGFPDPYNICFGDYIKIRVIQNPGNTASLQFGLIVKGK